MGKTANGAAQAKTKEANASEDSQNQGFLKIFGQMATHRQEVEGLVKSRKGLKSGEPFSSNNHINLSPEKGRK